MMKKSSKHSYISETFDIFHKIMTETEFMIKIVVVVNIVPVKIKDNGNTLTNFELLFSSFMLTL